MSQAQRRTGTHTHIHHFIRFSRSFYLNHSFSVSTHIHTPTQSCQCALSWSKCADEGDTCSCSGNVRYGAGRTWTEATQSPGRSIAPTPPPRGNFVGQRAGCTSRTGASKRRTPLGLNDMFPLFQPLGFGLWGFGKRFTV